VTQLLDPPISAGSTLYPQRAPISPADRGAEDFYLLGLRPTRQITITVSAPDGSLRRTWLAMYMEEQVNGLLTLPPGWDGRRALPPTDEAVRSAIDVLFAVADELSLPPQVFPLPDGGLQLEWHAGESVEIEVDSAGEAHLLATDVAASIVHNDALDVRNEASLAQARAAIRRLSVRLAGSR